MEAAQGYEAAAQEATGSIAGALGNKNVPCRQKTWDEMDAAQRMETMREEVRYLRRMVTDLQAAARKVKHHQHAQDGSLLVPFKNRDDDDHPRGYFYDPLK